jgi:hypothetical protein
MEIQMFFLDAEKIFHKSRERQGWTPQLANKKIAGAKNKKLSTESRALTALCPERVRRERRAWIPLWA